LPSGQRKNIRGCIHPVSTASGWQQAGLVVRELGFHTINHLDFQLCEKITAVQFFKYRLLDCF
jgi:hypothetical protein